MKLTKSDLRKILMFTSTVADDEVRQKALDALNNLNENKLNIECDCIYMVECEYRDWDYFEAETYYQQFFYNYDDAKKDFNKQVESAKEDYEEGLDVKVDSDENYFEIRENNSIATIVLKKIKIN